MPLVSDYPRGLVLGFGEPENSDTESLGLVDFSLKAEGVQPPDSQMCWGHGHCHPSVMHGGGGARTPGMQPHFIDAALGHTAKKAGNVDWIGTQPSLYTERVWPWLLVFE